MWSPGFKICCFLMMGQLVPPTPGGEVRRVNFAQRTVIGDGGGGGRIGTFHDVILQVKHGSIDVDDTQYDPCNQE
jgi:hypothetical protein